MSWTLGHLRNSQLKTKIFVIDRNLFAKIHTIVVCIEIHKCKRFMVMFHLQGVFVGRPVAQKLKIEIMKKYVSIVLFR